MNLNCIISEMKENYNRIYNRSVNNEEQEEKNLKKLTTLISVVAMMCAVIAALAFSIWAAVYGDSHYGFYKKEYQKYEVTEDLDMNIDHVMYVTEHMMNYLIGKEEKLSVVTTVEGKEQDFFNERDRLHMRDVRNLFLGGIKVGGVCLIVAAAILTMFKKREKDWKRLFCRAYSIALGVWLVIGVLLGIAFSIDFTTCFTIFHKLFFTNNLWIFNPETDYMIRMLPEGFFSDMVIRISEVFGAVLVVIWIVLFVFKKYYKKPEES